MRVHPADPLKHPASILRCTPQLEKMSLNLVVFLCCVYLFYLFINMVIVKLHETLQEILSLFCIRGIMQLAYIWECWSKSPDDYYHQNHMFLGTAVKNVLCSTIGNFHLGSWCTLQLNNFGEVWVVICESFSLHLLCIFHIWWPKTIF
jgi:hypothetical protein